MSLPKVLFEIIEGGLGRTTDSEDNVALLVAFSPSTTSNLPYRTGREYRSLQSVEADNVTDAVDRVDEVLVWFHASEFFRLNPEGVLHILLLEPSDMATLFDTQPTAPLWNYLQLQAGRIKQVAVAYNLDSSVTTHINTLVSTTISVAQSFATSLALANLWVDVIYLEGSNFDYTNISTVPGLRDPGRLAPNVAVVLGQDFNKAQQILSSSTPFEGTACVGAVLGLSTNKNIHESFARPIAKNNLQDVAYSNGDGRWLDAKIKTAERIGTMPISDLDELSEKGYIFPRYFTQLAGWYFNQSQNVVPETVDANSVELVQVINKVQRIALRVLTPEVNNTFSVKANGRIIDIERKRIESNLRQALAEMAENYSALPLVEVDPERNGAGTLYSSFLSDPTLRAVIGIRPLGKAEFIFVQIGYVQ